MLISLAACSIRTAWQRLEQPLAPARLSAGSFGCFQLPVLARPFQLLVALVRKSDSSLLREPVAPVEAALAVNVVLEGTLVTLA